MSVRKSFFKSQSYQDQTCDETIHQFPWILGIDICHPPIIVILQLQQFGSSFVGATTAAQTNVALSSDPASILFEPSNLDTELLRSTVSR